MIDKTTKLKTLSNNWILLPQEMEGTYTFSGNMYSTKRIHDEIQTGVILNLISIIKKLAIENKGIDYLQVFIKGKRKIYIIDNLNEEMKQNKSNTFLQDNNYFTVMFAEEY